MRARPLLLLLLLALAVLAWALLRRTGEPDALEKDADDRAGGPTSAGPLLEGAPRAAPVVGGPGGQGQEPAAQDQQAATVRIHGVVVLPEGVAAEGGVVLVATTHSPRRRILAQQPLAQGRAFDFSVAYPWPEHSVPLRVVAGAPGVPIMESWLNAVVPGQTYHVELRPSELALIPIRGRVTDAQGGPVQRFTFALTERFSDGPLPESPADLLGAAAQREALWTTTDTQGDFEVHARAGESLWPLSLDPAWGLAVAGSEPQFPREAASASAQVSEPWLSVRPGQPPVRLIARRAFRLRGSVLDAASGRALERVESMFRVLVGERHVYGRGTALTAEYDWGHPTPVGPGEPFQVEVHARAWLYHDFDRLLEFADATLSQRLDIRLQPLSQTEIGRVVLPVRLRELDGEPAPIQVTYMSERQGSTIGWSVHPDEDQGEGSSPTYRMPAGRAQLALLPGTSAGSLMRWEGEVIVIGGGTTTLDVPWAPHGSLRIRLPVIAGASARLEQILLRAPDGKRESGVYVEASAREVVVQHIPVGVWTVIDQTARKSREQTVEIRADATTEVELSP